MPTVTISPTTTQYTLGLLPDSQGFTVTSGQAETLSTLLDGGAPRFRALQIGVIKLVSCQWSLNADDYDYICAFYRTATANGSRFFFITLAGIDGAALTQYTAAFVPQTWKLLSQKGMQYVQWCQLYVIPNAPDSTTDIELLGRYNG